MDGSHSAQIVDQLFGYATYVVETEKRIPYVSIVAKGDVVIAKGLNMAYDTYDITSFGDVVAIRSAQEALETGNLEGYSLYSFFEPVLMGFDIALWSGIKHFVWCINSKSYRDKYNKMSYTPLVYAESHPEVEVAAGIRDTEALKIADLAIRNNYFPDNIHN